MVKTPMMITDKKPLSKFGESAGKKTRGHQARNASCSSVHSGEQIPNTTYRWQEISPSPCSSMRS